MKKLTAILATLFVIGSFVSVQAANQYVIDQVHSTVGFTVKHMLFSTVRGNFNDVNASVEIDPDTKDLNNIRAEIMVASVDTDNAKRDGHLRSDDFFNAEMYPTITFESTKVERTGGNNYRVEGNLTIRDVTKPVVLEGEMLGFLPGRAAFRAEGQINRMDYNVKWNRPLQKLGGVTVSEEVGLAIEVAMTLPNS